MKEMRATARPTPSLRESVLSLGLCGVLLLIALIIFKGQFDYDPGLWRAHSGPAEGSDAPGLTSEAAAALDRSAEVAGVTPMSPPEHFGAERLSDKINGKAELYLPSGFRHLESRRLALVEDQRMWMERFIYDMGTYANAFAVFSQQRRENARPLDVSPDAYRSANGLFFVQGPFYVEIIGSEASSALMDRMEALARAFVDAHPAETVTADEPGVLPAADRVADSLTLTAANTFGFEGFDQIYSARYQWNGRTAIAYVSRRESPDQADALADAYVDALLSFGGRPVVPPEGAPPMRIIEMFDLVMIIFTRGEWLAGVHEAETLADGLALAASLYRRIDERAP